MDKLSKLFGKIYDDNINKIYRFIFIKVNSTEIAQDLTSETFLKGWKSFSSGGKSIDNPSAFLYRIARNLVTDYYRQKAQNSVISADSVEISDPRSSVEEKASFNSDMEIVLAAMSHLKDDYKEVVSLHYIDDLPVPKIAGIVEKPEGTVRVMLHRALKELKDNLAK